MAAVIDRRRIRTIPLLIVSGVLLSGCSGKPTQEWIARLQSGDSAERLHAVKSLAERGGDAAVVVPALAQTLSHDQDAFVRRDAAAALGKLGAAARPAVPALLAAARDRNAGVRKEAARALGRIEPEGAGKSAAR